MPTRRSLLGAIATVGATTVVAGCLDTVDSIADGGDDDGPSNGDELTEETGCGVGESAVRAYHDRDFEELSFPADAVDDGMDESDFEARLEYLRDNHWPVSGTIESVDCACIESAERRRTNLADDVDHEEFPTVLEMRFDVSHEDGTDIVYATALEYEGAVHAWAETDWVDYHNCVADDHQ